MSADHFDDLYSLHEHNINPSTREIYIGGFPPSINDDAEYGVDHQMACEFIRNITFLQGISKKPITIHQCTVGGDWSYGMAIYNAIEQSPCKVTIIAHAHARSMSSIIPQAADHRIIMPDCYFMIHHGTITIEDTHKGAHSYMAMTAADRDRMMDIYTSRCHMTAGEIESRLDMAQEWYMSAKRAVELGFMDEVAGGR